MNDSPTASSGGFPGTLTAVLALIALVVAAFLWSRLKRHLRMKANQHLFSRRDHRDGRQLVTEQLHFTLRVSSREIREAVLASVRLSPQCPALIPDAYVLDVTDAEIVIGYGSKLAPRNFTASLELRPQPHETEEPRPVSAVWGLRSWTLSDGVTDGVSVMRRLREDIEAALHGLDPGLSRTVVRAPVPHG